MGGLFYVFLLFSNVTSDKILGKWCDMLILFSFLLSCAYKGKREVEGLDLLVCAYFGVPAWKQQKRWDLKDFPLRIDLLHI